jgi:hypothetical protein
MVNCLSKSCKNDNINNDTNYKLLLKDKVGNSYKINDGFDDYRDLISLEAKYDDDSNPTKINVKISFNKYNLDLYKEQDSVVLLMDFISDDGNYLLPFGIKGATDHWWDIAFKINNFNKKIQAIDSLNEENFKDPVVVDKIDEQNGSIYLTIDLEILRKYGFIDQMPLYIQVLTVHNTKEGYKIIMDSFNDPKPWENSNFLIGALPVNIALKYPKSYKTCS